MSATCLVTDTKITIFLIEKVNTPDKGSKSEIGRCLVYCLDFLKDRGNLTVLDHSEHSVVELRPGVVAKARDAVETSLAFHIHPAGKAPLTMLGEHINDVFVICLIVCDKYCFHLIDLIEP